MFILKKGHQPGVYVPLRALFLVLNTIISQKQKKLPIEPAYVAPIAVVPTKISSRLSTLVDGSTGWLIAIKIIKHIDMPFSCFFGCMAFPDCNVCSFLRNN